MDAVLTAMVEEKIGPGERNRLLIQTAREQLRFDYALALRSPAVALHLALKALDARPGQAVVVSALSPRFYLDVLSDLQLTPVFCDVTFDFPCLSRESVESAVESARVHAGTNSDGLRIAAVAVHHTLGFVPDTASIAQAGFPVIEDISQSYGSWLATGGEPAFNGVFCVLGLEERDMLTSGGGALLFAANRKDGSALRGFAGIADEYCLPDINAALAVVQFREVARNIERRNEITRVYAQASLRARHKRFIPRLENENNCYSFSLVLETGLKDVVSYAKKKDIILENAFDKTAAGAGACGGCGVSNSLAMRTVLFPVYPRLRSADVERVSRLIMTLP